MIKIGGLSTSYLKVRTANQNTRKGRKGANSPGLGQTLDVFSQGNETNTHSNFCAKNMYTYGAGGRR